jgi:hypothetical protein
MFIRQITGQPSYTTTAASVPDVEKVVVDNVVMCSITARLLIQHDLDTDALFDVAVVTCLVIPSEHQRISHLWSKPELRHLPDQMLAASSSDELLPLGWKGYKIQGVDCWPLDTPAEV